MSPEASSDRPNVVLIVTDDQGYGDLSCHGNPTVETPNMDRFRDSAARLEDFHVGTTCAPTRASVMTGRHKLRTGVWHTVNGRSLLHREEVTMADVFADEGYRTGIFGKWHLGDNYPYRPQDRGFDEVFVHGGGGVVQTPDYWGNDYFDDTYFRGGEVPESVDGYCTDVWFDEAIQFVERNVDGDRPFFCYLPTNAPHGPTQVPDEYRARYEDEVSEHLARYFGMITNIDDNLGRLRRRLRELDISRETIVVFMGDNGTIPPAADHYNAGMRGAKGDQYDGGHRVHGFVHWPGQIEDTDVARLTRHYDLLPTFADYCGLDLPAVELDGRSLRPLLDDGEAPWPDRTMVVDTQRVERPEKWRRCSVMTDRWRLVNGEELYDIEADPGQRHDVSDDHSDVVADLHDRYDEWWGDVSDRFDSYCRIVLGNEAENPATLTAHDWHETGSVPWNQVKITEAEESDGFWAVDVETAGTYAIELRRWPEECGAEIRAIPDSFERVDYGAEEHWSGEGVAIDPERATLEIGDIKRSRTVPPGAEAVSFEVDLPVGPAKLRTRFTESDGTERGAYYTTVKRK